MMGTSHYSLPSGTGGGGSTLPSAPYRYTWAGGYVNYQNTSGPIVLDTEVSPHPNFELGTGSDLYGLVAKAGTAGSIWMQFVGLVGGDGSGTGTPSGTMWVEKNGVLIANSTKIVSSAKLQFQGAYCYAPVAYVAGDVIKMFIDHSSGTSVGFWLVADAYEMHLTDIAP